MSWRLWLGVACWCLGIAVEEMSKRRKNIFLYWLAVIIIAVGGIFVLFAL